MLSLDVIEHVDNDVHILESLYEIVKPGGHLIITVPAFESLWSEHDEINQHKRRYRVPRLRKMMENAGFEVSRITYCNSTLFLPVMAMRKGKTWCAQVTGSRQPMIARSPILPFTRARSTSRCTGSSPPRIS